MRNFFNLKIIALLLLKVISGCHDPGESESDLLEPGTVVIDSVKGRKMQIYLPPGFNEDSTYPFAVFHDGQNLFDASTAYADELYLDEVLDSLIQNNLMDPVVIIGVYNSDRRAEEYVPYVDPELTGVMGLQSWDSTMHHNFAQLIIKELLPAITEKYSLSVERNDRAIFGSSLGALHALYLGTRYSNSFSFVGCISPSTWVANGKVIDDISKRDLSDLKIWIDQGSKEYDPNTLRFAVSLSNLSSKKYGQDLWYYEHKGGSHNEKTWSKRISYPLLLFKGKNITQEGSLTGELLIGYQEWTEGEKKIFPRVNGLWLTENKIKYDIVNNGYLNATDWKIDSVGNIMDYNMNNTNTTVIRYRDKEVILQTTSGQISSFYQHINQ